MAVAAVVLATVPLPVAVEESYYSTVVDDARHLLPYFAPEVSSRTCFDPRYQERDSASVQEPLVAAAVATT